MKKKFNDGWLFGRSGETERKKVTLPHDAMLAEPRGAESAGGTHTGWFAGSDYIYEKEFELEQISDKHFVFEFEGVYHDAEVYINSNKAIHHPNGYTGFYAEADAFIKEGTNVIRVEAKNSDQPNSRWYSGAGIYRPVYLHELPEKYIQTDGIRITTTSYLEPTVKVSVQTNAAGSVKIEILDGEEIMQSSTAEGNGSFSLDIHIKGAELWSTESPKLYQCRVYFGEDQRLIPFGLRILEWDPQKGFCINGQREILRGCCVHHDNGLLGACAYDFAEERKVLLLKESGYNAIRSAHNPCSKALLDACDRHGMLVLDEYMDMWYIHKNKYDYADQVRDHYGEDLKAIIAKDYNHPSVIGYSIGNEVAETGQQEGIHLCEKMVETCHQLDDTRMVTCGINIFFNYLSSLGLGVYSDEKAEKNDGSKVGSEFYNNLAGIFGAKFMKWGATLRGSDRKTRDAFEKLDVAGYNYGCRRYKKDLKKYPGRLIMGSETFCTDAYDFWELAKENPALIGDFVWTGLDYLGEVGLGAWEYQDYAPDFKHGPGWITAGSGRLDITGRGHGEMAYTRVAFELDQLRMAVVPVGYAGQKHSPSAWRMTNAIESWSWNGKDGENTRIEVYTRAARVELFVNGKMAGNKKRAGDCRIIFKTQYYGGELKAVAYDTDNNITAIEVLETAGEETKLTLIPEERRGELLYVRLQYTDEKGNLKPLIRGDIKIRVEGGKLLGLGNGCSFSERGYLTDTTDTYYGEALAVIYPEAEAVNVFGSSKWGDARICVR